MKESWAVKLQSFAIAVHAVSEEKQEETQGGTLHSFRRIMYWKKQSNNDEKEDHFENTIQYAEITLIHTQDHIE